MKRFLLLIIAAVAVAAVGTSSASAVTPASAPTNAAAVVQVKKLLRFISNHQYVRMYKALAPKQRNLLSQKKWVKCAKAAFNKIQSWTMTKTIAVRTSTRTKIPGYRGVHVLNKRVIFKSARKQNGKVRHKDFHQDVAYVKGAFHWWLTHRDLVSCRLI